MKTIQVDTVEGDARQRPALILHDELTSASGGPCWIFDIPFVVCSHDHPCASAVNAILQETPFIVPISVFNESHRQLISSLCELCVSVVLKSLQFSILLLRVQAHVV